MSSLETVLLRAGEDDQEIDLFFEGSRESFAQQGVAWREVITRVDSDEPMFLGCRSGGKLVGVLPGYRFSGALGAILTSVPQAGPLGGVAVGAGAPAAEIYAALLDAYVGLAHKVGASLATVITNPFWPDREHYSSFSPDFSLENSCLALDLERDVAGEEFPNASKQLARQLRRADASGFCIDEEQSASNVEAWYALHATRHQEIGATPLPQALFTAALSNAVPRGKARFFFVRDEQTGEMLGGGFYVMHGRVVDALMPAVSAEQAKRGANYFLARHTILWAQDTGYRFYNWQASPPSGGVYRFKQQWGSRDHSYAYLTRVTGDVTPFLESTPERVRDAYPWHYVMPFDRIGAGARKDDDASSRKQAWESLADEQ